LSTLATFISLIEAAAFAVALCDLASGFAKIVPMILRHSLHQRLQMCVTLCYLHDFAHSCFFLLLVLDVANTLSFFCCDAASAPCSTHAASTSGHCFIHFSVDNLRFSSHCSRLWLMLHADLPFILANPAAILAAARQWMSARTYLQLWHPSLAWSRFVMLDYPSEKYPVAAAEF
jgi:hypothetical protein